MKSAHPTLEIYLKYLTDFLVLESKAGLRLVCSAWTQKEKSWSIASIHYSPSPSLPSPPSPPVAFRCKISRHMERRSFSGPPKDSDCMTNHVHHHSPNPTQNLQTTASLEWKREFLQLCRVKLRPLPLLNYSIVGSSFKLSHSKPYGFFEHLQAMPP